MQVFIAILPRILIVWHTNASVMLVCHGVERFQIFKITVNDQN